MAQPKKTASISQEKTTGSYGITLVKSSMSAPARPMVRGVTSVSTAICVDRRWSLRRGWYRTLKDGLSMGCFSVL